MDSLIYLDKFLFEQLRITAHSFGPRGEGVDYTKLGREVMVAIPL